MAVLNSRPQVLWDSLSSKDRVEVFKEYKEIPLLCWTKTTLLLEISIGRNSL